MADNDVDCSNTLFDELETWNKVLDEHKHQLRGPRP